MFFEEVPAGINPPEDINVVIEIPWHSAAVKYEVDKKSGAFFVDRFMSTSMYYPTNYGYVPHTLSEDDDPVDVLVLSPVPLIPGAVVNCRPIGMLKMTDESGIDAKILAVPNDKLSTLYRHINEFDQIEHEKLDSISHFFEHYKDLEKSKWVKVDGWVGSSYAKQEITSSLTRYEKITSK
ncbi:MAG: inorganic diphosphatase [Legionellales bacterium]|nr:inorganic diphosphatase [Legionellales bacterium]